MKAMLFAAGLGSRLAPLTNHTPKPMLPVQGKPLIHWQLTALAAAGVTDVVINLHHLGEQIREFVQDGSAWRLRVHFSQEDRLLETGGGLMQVLHHFGEDPFWVVNGDIWTDFNFNQLPTILPPGALAHFVLTPTPSWRSTGDFESDGSWITARGDSYCYCSISLWSLAALADAPNQTSFSLRDVFFALMNRGQLSCQIFHGMWHDIGTFEHYQSIATNQSKPIDLSGSKTPI